MWGEVVRIAPDSAGARTISVHLKSLDASPAPNGTAPAPGVPAGAAPAAPVASPAESGN